MSSTVLLLGVIALMVIYMVVVELLDRRPPPELRGDWWAGFEEQFRAYAHAHRRSGAEPGA
jgi:hypothetical protein